MAAILTDLNKTVIAGFVLAVFLFIVYAVAGGGGMAQPACPNRATRQSRRR